MASTRFPGKPLVDLGGKPMLQWVYEACQRAALDVPIVIATPDEEIYGAGRLFGASVVMTRNDHPSGTDRLAEVAELLPADAYINVQGDEPLIDPVNIQRCASLISQDGVDMASLYVQAGDNELQNPAAVKVVVSLDGFALYFSRSLIPYPRNAPSPPVKKHLGIYAYSSRVLTQFKTWSMSPLEATEGLEQLRFLEHGVRIKMGEGVNAATAVDTPEQADEVRRILASQS